MAARGRRPSPAPPPKSPFSSPIAPPTASARPTRRTRGRRGPGAQRRTPGHASGPFTPRRSTMAYIDPVAVSPAHYRLVLENDRVRVLEMTLKAGEIDEEHSHPP